LGAPGPTPVKSPRARRGQRPRRSGDSVSGGRRGNVAGRPHQDQVPQPEAAQLAQPVDHLGRWARHGEPPDEVFGQELGGAGDARAMLRLLVRLHHPGDQVLMILGSSGRDRPVAARDMSEDGDVATDQLDGLARAGPGGDDEKAAYLECVGVEPGALAGTPGGVDRPGHPLRVRAHRDGEAVGQHGAPGWRRPPARAP
jgi:hypothetical protein